MATAPQHGRSKSAAPIGGDQEVPFEQAFANIAYVYIKDRMPSLLDKIVGFEMLDKNDDDTRAVGVFGFQIGRNDWLFAPVFFLNGKHKGQELLWVAKPKMFCPSKENWVNYLTNRKSDTLGEKADREPGDAGIKYPDLSMLRRLLYRKYGSVAKTGFPSIPDEGLAVYLKMAQEAFYDDKGKFNPAIARDLPDTALGDLLANDVGSLKVAHLLYETYAPFREGFDRFYGGQKFFLDCGEKLEVKLASALKPKLTAKIPGISADEDDEEKKKPALARRSVILPPAKKNAAEVVTDSEVAKPGSGSKVRVIEFTGHAAKVHSRTKLTEKEKETFRREGVLFFDDRKESEKAEVFRPDLAINLQNPTQNGIYDVLVQPDVFEKCVVITSPVGQGGYDASDSIVVVVAGKRKGDFCQAPNNAIWVKSDEPSRWWDPKNSWSEVYRRAIGAAAYLKSKRFKPADSSDSRDTVNSRGRVVFITQDLTGSALFESDRYSVAREDAYPVSGCYAGSISRSNFDLSCCGPAMRVIPYKRRPEYVRPDGPSGTKMRVAADELLLPSDAKALEVSGKTLALGDLSRLEHGLRKQASLLKVRIQNAGNEYTIDGWLQPQLRFDKVAALKHLVLDRNTDVEDARMMLAEAAEKGTAEFVIKNADQPYLSNNRPTAPRMATPPDGWDSFPSGASVPVQEPYEVAQIADGLPPTVNELGWQPDKRVLQTASRASQKGQKQVFDTAALKTLVKNMRPESIVSDAVSAILGGMNKMGSVLFTLYWHPEFFEDRYGKADMPELEDALKSSFEASGDTGLFLREKEVRPFGESGDEIGPSVDDTAENE